MLQYLYSIIFSQHCCDNLKLINKINYLIIAGDTSKTIINFNSFRNLLLNLYIFFTPVNKIDFLEFQETTKGIREPLQRQVITK